MEVFSCLRDEEDRKNVMTGPTIHDSSALKTDKEVVIVAATAVGRKGGPRNKDSLWCDYCNKARHTRETCWKIHGKPERKVNSRVNEKTSRSYTAENAAANEGQMFSKN